MRTMIQLVLCATFAVGCLIVSEQAYAQRKAPPVSQPVTPAGEPVLEVPTMHCLGAWWIIPGDEEKQYRVDMFYRRTGEECWLIVHLDEMERP